MIFSLRSKIKKVKIKGESTKHILSKSIFFGNYQKAKASLKNVLERFACLIFCNYAQQEIEELCILWISSVWTIGKVPQLQKFAKTSKSNHPTGHHQAGSRGSRFSQIKNRNIAAVAFSISKPLSSEFQFLGAIMCTNHSSKVRFFWGLTWIIIDSKFKLFPRMKTYDKNKNNKFFYLPCGFPKNFIFYTHHDQLEIKLVTGLVHC